MTLSDQAKDRARLTARAVRKQAFRQSGDAGPRIAAHFFQMLDRLRVNPQTAVVAGYRPVGSEADVWTLMQQLDARQIACALPVVQSQSTPLSFRQWHVDTPLVAGLHKTEHPGADAASVEPDVVLTPLLAFDDQGYRLGQGGGYYDRTLSALRVRKPVIAIGIAFAAQEVDAVPRSGHDERLDAVITEKAPRLFT